MRPTRPAFTLVELVAVIGIIAILLGLLLSVAGGVRKQARLVQCFANLRGIGQACQSHAAANGGYLPLAGRITALPKTDPQNYPAGINDDSRTRYTYASSPGSYLSVNVVPFVAALAPYLGVDNLPRDDWNKLDQALNARQGAWRRFVCPATDSLEKAKANNNPNDENVVDQATMMVCAIGPDTITAWSTNSDYGANEGVFGYHYDPRYRRNRLGGHLSTLKHPEQFVLFTDALPRKDPADPIMSQGWITWTPTLGGTGPATLGDAVASTGRVDSAQSFDLLRHAKRINIAFADGHVETFPITKEALDQAYVVEP